MPIGLEATGENIGESRDALIVGNPLFLSPRVFTYHIVVTDVILGKI